MKPGVYRGVSDSDYHADADSLSSSGARMLLTCPAAYRYTVDHPDDGSSTDYFDIGTVVHTLVLGVGRPMRELPFDKWNSDAAKKARDEAIAAGEVPLKPSEAAQARAMAKAVHDHPLAAALLRDGEPELSLWWQDRATGVMLRARPDWTPTVNRRRRLILTDLKTSKDPRPSEFGRTAASFGYHMQAAWYPDGARELDLDPDPAFVFVLVGKTPPYPVSVVELDADAIELGRRRNRRAINLYADCLETGHWPAYGDDVHLVGLPKYAFYDEESLA